MTLRHAQELFGDEVVLDWMTQTQEGDMDAWTSCAECKDRLGGVRWVHEDRWLGATASKRWICGVCDAEYPFAEMPFRAAEFRLVWDWLMGRRDESEVRDAAHV